jgi:quercetin dioxygenase-like cupin family protein
MRRSNSVFLVSALLLVSLAVSAQEPGIVRPQVLMREIVAGMPRGDKQEVRVMNVSFQPGARTLFHTHRHPVTVYVTEGVFTMEMGTRGTITVKAGQAAMMPPGVNMTGFNRSTTDTLRLVAFYVSEPDEPFLDPIASERKPD